MENSDDITKIANSPLATAVIEAGLLKGKAADALLKSTKNLMTVLITDEQWGEDMFDDYQITIKYKKHHMRTL